MGAFTQCQSQAAIKEVDAIAFENLIKLEKDLQLLDVRTVDEYKSGHLANCILGDITDASAYAKAIAVLNKQKPVYVYCLSGGRSHKAAKDLAEKGFTSIIELKGGINAWRSHSYTEEKSENQNQMHIEAFQKLLQPNGINLICIQSKYCGPCVKMKPVIDSIAKHYPTVQLIKIDGGIDQIVMKSLQVNEIPSFIVIKNGKETFRKTGIVAQSILVEAIQNSPKFR